MYQKLVQTDQGYQSHQLRGNFDTYKRRYWSFKKNNLGSGGGWHKDAYYPQFKSILYLNDVDNKKFPTKSNIVEIKDEEFEKFLNKVG